MTQKSGKANRKYTYINSKQLFSVVTKVVNISDDREA